MFFLFGTCVLDLTLRGATFFRFLFGDFRCQKAVVASYFLQTRIQFVKICVRALRARKCHGMAPENINRKQYSKNFILSVG
jgi:hypothetical protein